MQAGDHGERQGSCWLLLGASMPALPPNVIPVECDQVHRVVCLGYTLRARAPSKSKVDTQRAKLWLVLNTCVVCSVRRSRSPLRAKCCGRCRQALNDSMSWRNCYHS